MPMLPDQNQPQKRNNLTERVETVLHNGETIKSSLCFLTEASTYLYLSL